MELPLDTDDQIPAPEETGLFTFADPPESELLEPDAFVEGDELTLFVNVLVEILFDTISFS